MFREVKHRVWAFDLEWVPDPAAGRLVYGLPDDVADPREIFELMWQRGGATAEEPTPFLKLAMCRIVSIAVVERRIRRGGQVQLNLASFPANPDNDDLARESRVVGEFFELLGESRPQLVGFNSQASDLRILVQRATILGLQAREFCARPEKPWEGIDYFARGSDWNVDLRDILGGFGRAMPSLHEIAVQCGIPGKLDTQGEQVAELWLRGELRRIVEYNECDALSTYLLWLRVAHLAGHFSRLDYEEEQKRVEDLLVEQASRGREHLARYLGEWRRLRAAIAAGR